MISINCHGCRTSFIDVSVVRQTRDDHWRRPKCKPAWLDLIVIEDCRVLIRTIVETFPKSTRTSLGEMYPCQTLESLIITAFNAPLSFLTARDRMSREESDRNHGKTIKSGACDDVFHDD